MQRTIARARGGLAFLMLVCNWVIAGNVPQMVEWLKVFDKGGDDEHGEQAQQTADGGYIIVGSRSVYSGITGILLIKTDSEGNETWSRTLGDDFGSHAEQTTDGGYVVLGGSSIIKTDSEGNEVWSFPLSDIGASEGIAGWFIGRCLSQVSDEGYMVAGSYEEDDDCQFQVFLTKFSPESVQFIRGDANRDTETSIADAIFTLSYLFAEGVAPSCLDAADANDDGEVDITDAIAVLSHLFAGTGDLPEPFDACGVDPTQDELRCLEYPGCE